MAGGTCFSLFLHANKDRRRWWKSERQGEGEGEGEEKMPYLQRERERERVKGLLLVSRVMYDTSNLLEYVLLCCMQGEQIPEQLSLVKSKGKVRDRRRSHVGCCMLDVGCSMKGPVRESSPLSFFLSLLLNPMNSMADQRVEWWNGPFTRVWVYFSVTLLALHYPLATRAQLTVAIMDASHKSLVL